MLLCREKALVAPGGSSVSPGGSLWLLAAPGDSWWRSWWRQWLLVAAGGLGGSWWLLVSPAGFWWPFVALGDSCGSKRVPVDKIKLFVKGNQQGNCPNENLKNESFRTSALQKLSFYSGFNMFLSTNCSFTAVLARGWEEHAVLQQF